MTTRRGRFREFRRLEYGATHSNQESNRHRRLKVDECIRGEKHYYRVSALFPRSTGTDSVPFSAFRSGISAYGSYTKGDQWRGKVIQVYLHWLSWFNKLWAGVLICIGPALAALHGWCPRTKEVCEFDCKTQGKTSRSPRDILYSFLHHVLVSVRDARLIGAA